MFRGRKVRALSVSLITSKAMYATLHTVILTGLAGHGTTGRFPPRWVHIGALLVIPSYVFERPPSLHLSLDLQPRVIRYQPTILRDLQT